MRFKIDENLRKIATAKQAEPEAVAVELCTFLVNTGMIEDTADNWGASVSDATEQKYVADVCAVFAGFLYGEEEHTIPADLFNALCSLTILGDGDCPNCGGNLVYDETEGHELNDGDYNTPNSWVPDLYCYHCANCGEIYKTPTEL